LIFANANSIKDNSEFLSIRFKQNLDRLYYYYIQNISAITCSELGWGKKHRSDNVKDLLETGKTAAKIHTYSDLYSEKNVKIFKENLKTLNTFSEFCNQRDIKLILVTLPAYHTYRENISSEQLNKMIETMSGFVTLNPNCSYYNWLDDADFVEDDFYDADHLNEKGAEKLSKKLSRQIIL
jgi:hypothetical protein